MSSDLLPLGWGVAPLSDLVTIVRGVTYKKVNSINLPELGFLPVLRANNIQNGKLHFDDLVYVPIDLISEHQKIRAGDIIVAMSSGSRNLVGKSARSNEDWNGGFGAFCGLLRPSSLVSNRYASWFTYSAEYRAKVSELSAGVNINNLKPAHFDEIEIPVAPLAEQKKIAAKLDELLAQVDTLKTRLDAIPAILKRFRQSVLAAAVSGRLTEDWRGESSIIAPSLDEIKEAWKSTYLSRGERHKNLFLEPLEDTLQPLPSEWLWTQVGYVFDVYVGATPSRKEPEYWGGDVNWISSSEVAFCRIRSTKETITKAGLAKASTRVHPPGTVMLAMIGQGKTRGQPAILDTYACHNQNTAAIRVLSEFCVPEFLYYFLSEHYEETRRIGSGNNQKAMNKKVVQTLPFPLPPIEEQTEIVHQVEKLFAFADQIEQHLNAAQSRINHLTQSILAKAFRGELTAEWREQNPDLISGENSAEALLEKIKAGREALDKLKKPIRRRVKKKTGEKMKEIMTVVTALESSGKALTAQELLAQAGYSSNASIDQLEQFFLDIREQLDAGTITRHRVGTDDIFTLTG